MILELGAGALSRPPESEVGMSDINTERHRTRCIKIIGQITKWADKDPETILDALLAEGDYSQVQTALQSLLNQQNAPEPPRTSPVAAPKELRLTDDDFAAVTSVINRHVGLGSNPGWVWDNMTTYYPVLSKERFDELWQNAHDYFDGPKQRRKTDKNSKRNDKLRKYLATHTIRETAAKFAMSERQVCRIQAKYRRA